MARTTAATAPAIPDASRPATAVTARPRTRPRSAIKADCTLAPYCGDGVKVSNEACAGTRKPHSKIAMAASTAALAARRVCCTEANDDQTAPQAGADWGLGDVRDRNAGGRG